MLQSSGLVHGCSRPLPSQVASLRKVIEGSQMIGVGLCPFRFKVAHFTKWALFQGDLSH